LLVETKAHVGELGAMDKYDATTLKSIQMIGKRFNPYKKPSGFMEFLWMIG
jgi:hypothetical protein